MADLPDKLVVASTTWLKYEAKGNYFYHPSGSRDKAHVWRAYRDNDRVAYFNKIQGVTAWELPDLGFSEASAKPAVKTPPSEGVPTSSLPISSTLAPPESSKTQHQNAVPPSPAPVVTRAVADVEIPDVDRVASVEQRSRVSTAASSVSTEPLTQSPERRVPTGSAVGEGAAAAPSAAEGGESDEHSVDSEGAQPISLLDRLALRRERRVAKGAVGSVVGLSSLERDGTPSSTATVNVHNVQKDSQKDTDPSSYSEDANASVPAASKVVPAPSSAPPQSVQQHEKTVLKEMPKATSPHVAAAGVTALKTAAAAQPVVSALLQPAGSATPSPSSSPESLAAAPHISHHVDTSAAFPLSKPAASALRDPDTVDVDAFVSGLAEERTALSSIVAARAAARSASAVSMEQSAVSPNLGGAIGSPAIFPAGAVSIDPLQQFSKAAQKVRSEAATAAAAAQSKLPVRGGAPSVGAPGRWGTIEWVVPAAAGGGVMSYQGEIEPSTGLRHGCGVQRYLESKDLLSAGGASGFRGQSAAASARAGPAAPPGAGRSSRKDYASQSLAARTGTVYTGEWVRGLRHGHGVQEFGFGGSYSGQYSADKAHGAGVLHFGGCVYDGAFSADKLHGPGSLLFPSGDHIQALFHEDSIGSVGTLTLTDGSSVTWNGAVVRSVGSDGTEYTGHVAVSSLPIPLAPRHGKGVLRLPNHYRYEGEFVNGRPEGKGHLVFPSGAEYDGEFKAGQMHGKGAFNATDGTQYHCQWVNGLPHGSGTVDYFNGDSWSGTLAHGRRVGMQD